MASLRVHSIAPFFIVGNIGETIAFYCDKLGFETEYKHPQADPFFAIVRRDEAMIFLKREEGVLPMPNPSRHPSLKWDAYVSITDPEVLAAEFAGRGVSLHKPLMNTSEGLRGLEVRDPNGYVLFFGRPR